MDPFAFVSFLDCLVNHPTLATIEFCRDDIDEDTASAVIQKLYYNQALQKINLDGNPISISLFKQNVIKPYFSSRKDFKIYIA